MDFGDWDNLRREAYRLERDLDVRLSSYAKLGMGYANARAQVSKSHWKSMEMEIENLLERLLDVNEVMIQFNLIAKRTKHANKYTFHRKEEHDYQKRSWIASSKDAKPADDALPYDYEYAATNDGPNANHDDDDAINDDTDAKHDDDDDVNDDADDDATNDDPGDNDNDSDYAWNLNKNGKCAW
ncbi:pheromone-processing carboxypeptidase KEX1-like [Dioscorea cayenensis subsp. rotundata]|uniref:Pheromone-processing carboxypeptidase KEX1-like n=1 Tax=Dioscorea cayennensis subsp. rotundata TaxID=55577 RepID=A0AB40C6Y3_DIOCR|nr:pheromone-processing carboxypeptidase KEX1-like [Dioscorea cayenensis subsp. rotundata]